MGIHMAFCSPDEVPLSKAIPAILAKIAQVHASFRIHECLLPQQGAAMTISCADCRALTLPPEGTHTAKLLKTPFLMHYKRAA
jgi:hypothetical protein